MSQLPIEEWLRAARVYAAERMAWFAPALYAAPLRLSETLPTPAAIDQHGRVYFNPRLVAQIYEQMKQDKQKLVQQLGFLWYHEVLHWLRRHGERAEAIRAEPELWNLACDMEINDYLPEGLAYPDFGGAFRAVFPQDYELEEGRTAEWYYRRLLEQRQQQQQPSQGGGGSGEQSQRQQPSQGRGSSGERDEQDQSQGGDGSDEQEAQTQAQGLRLTATARRGATAVRSGTKAAGYTVSRARGSCLPGATKPLR